MKAIIFGTFSITASLFFYSCSGKNQHKMDKKDSKKNESIDLSLLDSTIVPGDNFFDYVNKKWIDKNPIPASKSGWGMFTILVENSMKVLQDIQEKASKDNGAKPGSNTQIIGDFYASGMDSSGIDKAGIQPLQPMLQEIDNLNTPDAIAHYYGKMSKNGGSNPFGFFVEQDLKNTSQYICYVSQSGLSLPDRDYYFRTDDKSVANREAYKNYIKQVFVMSGSDEPTALKQATNVYDIEIQFAKASMTLVEQRDPYATYNKMGLADLKKVAGNFNWDIYFSEIGATKVDSLIVGMPLFMKAWNAMLKKVDAAKWKDYYKFQLINSYSTELSSEFDNAYFDFYDKQLRGIEVQEPRWKRITELSDYLLRDALGQEYVKTAFDENSKKKALELVENLRNALSERIKGLTWMGDSTKQKAQEKLGKIMVKIGYPDNWRSYEGIGIKKQHYVLNVMAATAFDFKRMLNKLGKPIDRTEWGMGPQTVNAYYNPLLNEIVFPAAILQPPFFDANADEAINYGGIGMVIGHELTHGFDDQGRQFDANGNLSNWWTKEDEGNFHQLAKKFVKQYNGYVPVDSVHVNGELTLGENIADLGGMIITYTAFKKATANKKDEQIGGLTADQRFFINFAQIWRTHYRQDAIIERLYTDPHSPPRYRVIGVLSNFPEFYKAFNVTDKNTMYIPDSLKCTMW
jgi:putative endopeptidase